MLRTHQLLKLLQRQAVPPLKQTKQAGILGFGNGLGKIHFSKKNSQSKAHKFKGLGTVVDVKNDQPVVSFLISYGIGIFQLPMPRHSKSCRCSSSISFHESWGPSILKKSWQNKDTCFIPHCRMCMNKISWSIFHWNFRSELMSLVEDVRHRNQTKHKGNHLIQSSKIQKWEAGKTQYVRGALWDIGIVFRSSLYRFRVFDECTYDMVTLCNT